MNFSQLSVKRRLGLSFGALVVALFLLSAMALGTLGATQARFEGFVTGDFARDALAREVHAATNARAVAARNLLLVTGSQDIAMEKRAVEVAHRRVQESLGALQQQVNAPGVGMQERRLFARVQEVEAQYGPVALDIVAKTLAGQREEAVRRLDGECRPLLRALIEATDAYVAFIAREGDAAVRAAQAQHRRSLWMLLGVCAVAVLLAVALAVAISRNLTRALGTEPRHLRAIAQRVASGDLGRVSVPADVQSDSVLSSLADMQSSLDSIVQQVRSTAEQIAAGSVQVASGNADLSQRTEHQASRLEQGNASMAQIEASVQHNAESAQHAAALASGARGTAERGGEVVKQVVRTMEEISTSSQRIGDIIGVIDGIAFQTNILALNAAVEAARAGEQGRGFAVVAAEVRTLAQRSAQSAREIKGLIGSSVQSVSKGAQLVAVAGETMAEIVTEVNRVADVIAEISHATVEQTRDIGALGQSIHELGQSTHQNAALVEQMAAAAQTLSAQAATLMQAVSLFRVQGDVRALMAFGPARG